ncbi:MAG: hypothetical protein OXE97_10555 [Gammaproteobacteria bacterium]|nr:hypothetical protein [Gammaproteobacteria bacterium]MCY4281463.1 hypothetical protein [Gammaproteobacteria bacterium]
MTGFLASVASSAEARQVCALGVDVLDLKDPARGALGALHQDRVRAIASLPDKNTLLSATIGDLPVYARELETRVISMHACGVDIVKVGVFDRTISPFMLSVLDRLAGRGISLVLVFFAELYPSAIDFQRLRRGGITGVMLDTCEKANGNLRNKLDDGALAEFVNQAGHSGLLTGLAGSLTRADIAPLLAINPDYLGFRGALCKQHRRTAQLDTAKVKEIRQLIPKNSNLLQYQSECVL